jgi:xanthine/CO dehydrogenase XdhC/CoxF family maturation factor
MTGLLKEVVDIYQRKGEGVLVTMCSTKGSTPRKAVAKMLVYPDGRVKGTIGGGELEFSTTEKALEIMKSEESILWERELIDLEMVCGGSCTLYLEYLNGECG